MKRDEERTLAESSRTNSSPLAAVSNTTHLRRPLPQEGGFRQSFYLVHAFCDTMHMQVSFTMYDT